MSDIVTLVMGGRPTLSNFADGVRHFGDLVQALTADESRDSAVEWLLDDLQFGSAVISIRGQGPATPINRIVQSYQRVGAELATGHQEVVTGRAQRAIRGLLSILDGHVDHIRFETAEGESIVRASATEAASLPEGGAFPIAAHGTVEGHVQSMSNRRSLRFTLYDVLWDQAVSCYLTAQNEELLADVWDRLVIVEGRVNRDPLTGRPTSVRDIISVRPVERGDPEAYLQARGAVTARAGAMSAEELLKRVWDE
jgi:hypothetical protein